MQLLEKTFKLKEHKTTVLTEVVGGITTFFAMAYIIFVNPNFLSQTGMDHTAVMLATCISAAIGSLLTAVLANVPFAQAPGMGQAIYRQSAAARLIVGRRKQQIVKPSRARHTSSHRPVFRANAAPCYMSRRVRRHATCSPCPPVSSRRPRPFFRPVR